MKRLAVTLALVCAASSASAQNPTPDIRGTWTGKGQSIVFGTNPHHPGAQTVTSPPRVQDFDFSFVVEGQDGRLAWGHNRSKAADTKEPFAWAISADGRTIVGADTDGQYLMSVQGPDRMEMCYSHSGLSPSKSIVATCFMMDRTKK